MRIKKAHIQYEIVTVIVIIGTILAVVLPSAITSFRKKEIETKLQKAYQVLNSTYYTSYNIQGEPSGRSVMQKAKEWFDEYWVPYIKVSRRCDSYKLCGYPKDAPYFQVQGENSTYKVILENTRVLFRTADGIVYILFASTKNSGKYKVSKIIMVDINGGHGPNTFGKDVFFFIRTENGFVKPYGYNLQQARVNADCSSKGHGYTCAEIISRNEWQIPENYPIKL